MSEATPEDVQEQAEGLTRDDPVEEEPVVADDVPVADALEQAVVVERDDDEPRD